MTTVTIAPPATAARPPAPATAARSSALDLPGGFGPEEVMLACRGRIEDIDRQVRGVISEIQKRNRAAQILGHLQDLARDHTTVAGSDGEQHWRNEAEFHATIAELREVDPEAARAAQAAYDGIAADGGGDDRDLDNLAQRLTNVLTDENSGTELTQILLQSLVSQRQQGLQLTTNLLQALHQSAMAPIQAIGH